MPPQPQATEFTKELRRRLIVFGGAGLGILITAGVVAYVISGNREVTISDATITAPVITLSPISAGRLNAVYVNPGDAVTADEPVALVGTEVVKAQVAGLMLDVPGTVGANIAPGDEVATMIESSALRVVGRIDENQGLAQIQVGDPVRFTVDAYGSRTFAGVVDQIAPSANASGVVFDISNARQVQQFDVEARFDTLADSFLRNGMSARMYVYLH